LGRTITTQDDQPKPRGEPDSPTANGVTTTLPSQRLADRVLALIAALRPQQWIKNLALFVGILFSQRLFVPLSFERTALAFAAFCMASSSIYLLNDLLDLENDRQHPVKCKRPLASGRLATSWAIGAMGVLVLASGGLTLSIFRIPIGQSSDTFAHYTLQELSETDIRCFLESWCPAVEMALSPEDVATTRETRAKYEMADLMNAIQTVPGVRRLAATPLLLRILAQLHRAGVPLPQRRVALYNQVVETLTQTWRPSQGQ